MTTKLTVTDQDSAIEEISPKLKELVSTVKLPADFDEKKELDNYYQSKSVPD